MTFLQLLWFVLIFFLIAVYFVLDGFDLGIGVVYPFLAKNEKEKAVLRRSVGPVWDGNEVWLLTAGGALFAAFAPAYATTFSGFYLAIMLVLFGLILRAVSIGFRSVDDGNSKIWDALFFIGSLLPALLFGVAIGNVLEGIQLDANGDYTGGFFALLNPFALLCGILGLCQCISQGLSWVAVKTNEGELHSRAVSHRGKMQVVTIVVFLLTTLVYFMFANPGMDPSGMPVRVISVVVLVVAFVLQLLWGRKGAEFDTRTFLASSLVCIGLVMLTASSLFPTIVPATDPSLSITIANAASSETALTAMTVIACIGVPLVLIYHFIVYRTFAGKIDETDVEE
ncbi:MAG: cytochrome d ubiquinol oxidase subunit II [Coriobacteriales bacterium]|jgi:cytochrome d ubiquinol oxidase subunit II